MSKELKPLVTFIMCSRRKNNPDSNLIEFLNSVAKHVEDSNVCNMEILIKFDTDDDESENLIYNRNNRTARRLNNGKRWDQPNLLLEYPHNVRHFVYNRGEGRRSLHNDYMFLFSQRNPNSKFISFVTDDCVISRPGLFNELLKVKDPDFMLMGDKEPRINFYGNYRTNQEWRMDVSMFPILSTKIVECCGSMGWQVNIDNWITLLHVILCHKYQLDLWRSVDGHYVTREGGASHESQYGKVYNPMEVNNLLTVNNHYYFDLVEQQARNIYLNYQARKFRDIAGVIKRALSIDFQPKEWAREYAGGAKN